ncbi:hypothetical protein ZWY2020_054945 [Hordeum vulgare]|nr:hypothetical protein ZWY2020_054945 [Hordeum vulgare]
MLLGRGCQPGHEQRLSSSSLGPAPLPKWFQGLTAWSNFPVATWANFVNCSRAITNSSDYKPVACLSTSSSFVYVLINSYSVERLKPSCGYLAMAALGDRSMLFDNASHGTLVGSLRGGFRVMFPFRYERTSGDFMGCLKDQIVPRPGQSLDYLVMYWLITIRTVDSEILSCAFGAHNFSSSEHLGPLHVAIVYSPLMLKFVVGVCSS